MANFSQQVLGIIGTRSSFGARGWETAESAVGISFPSDYKQLIDSIGPVLVDDWLCLYGPGEAGSPGSIVDVIWERDGAWDTLRQAGIDLDDSYFLPGIRLIAFAAVEATYFYWEAILDADPDSWGVVIVDDDVENWYRFDISATECIYGVLEGSILLDPFDDLFGRGEHRAVSL
ncbi:hypothetical protein [Actinoplanes sp. HUAS TT8]|uniref:hypothetical protein n=1 Tax=Actinoplanes sp. HUAS TT8 TaxID=3447453 RepID=UPI003F51F7AA